MYFSRVLSVASAIVAFFSLAFAQDAEPSAADAAKAAQEATGLANLQTAILAQAVPEPARSMLEAAAQTEDAAQVAAVAYAAGVVLPEHSEAIFAYGDYLRGVIAPLSGLRIDTVLARVEEKEVTPEPEITVRTAEQQVQPASAPKFLDLGNWSGKFSASGLIAKGNSRNTAGGLLIEASLPDGDFTHNLRGYFDYGRSNRVKTQQRWGASYKLDLNIDNNTFGYARFSYDEDEFSGFDYRLFAGFGAGHWILRNEKLALKVEGGPGYQYAPIDDTREIESHFAFYGATEFDWVITKGLKFEQDINATWTEPTTTLISTSSLTAAFSDSLSTGLSYMYRYETAPPAGRLKEDKTFRANITYGF